MEALKVRPEVTSFIDSICDQNSITNYKITDVQTNQKGEGYLGEIFMVTIKDQDTRNQLQFVIKAAFIDEKIREIAPIRKSFQNETNFYTNLYPAFQKFEKQCGVSKKREIVPKCYKTVIEENREMLALENLKEKGFECFEKTAELDHDHVMMIFKTYGRFHAYSFVIKDQEPEKYHKLTQGLYNVYDDFLQKQYFPDHLMEVSKFVQKSFIPGEDNEVIKAYEKYSGRNIVNFFEETITKNSEYSCILHGDCWSNNMMFKYESCDNTKRLKDIRLIDWQLTKVGSPVCDLSYCLYSGASKKVFDNLDEYLRAYHDSFSEFVKELGSDPVKLYPFEALKSDWRKFAKFGMIMAFAILRMKLTNKEDIIDLTDGFEMDEFKDLVANMRCNEKDYNSRIRGMVQHMYEIGAL